MTLKQLSSCGRVKLLHNGKTFRVEIIDTISRHALHYLATFLKFLFSIRIGTMIFDPNDCTALQFNFFKGASDKHKDAFLCVYSFNKSLEFNVNCLKLNL